MNISDVKLRFGVKDGSGTPSFYLENSYYRFMRKNIDAEKSSCVSTGVDGRSGEYNLLFHPRTKSGPCTSRCLFANYSVHRAQKAEPLSKDSNGS